MVLQSTRREIGDISVLDISGKITLGEGSATIRRVIRELIDSGQRKIVLNLEDVDYIDSSGIGELVAAHSLVETAQGELKLLNLTRRVRDILQITRLFTIFDVETDEATALRNFQ